MASDNGYIKLFSKFKYWGWYTDSRAVHLFIHLLISANYKDGFFLGEPIKRGELATSIGSLSEQTGLTHQEVRTRLKNFEKTGEINKRTNNRFTIITICKYESYQTKPDKHNKQPNKRLTNKQQTANKQLTTIEEDKTIRLKEEREKHSPASLVENHPVLDWIQMRMPELNTMEEPLTKRDMEILEKDYTKDGIKKTLLKMHNKWDIVQKYKSTYSTFVLWCEDKYVKPKA